MSSFTGSVQIPCRLILCSFLEFFLTFGAGDENFALASGYAHQLTALGAVIIPMLSVLDPIPKHQKPTVFPIPLIGIPGKGAENCPNHQSIGDRGQSHIHRPQGDEHGNQAQNQPCAQNTGIQFICAVATRHETANALLEFAHKKAP